MRKLLLLIVTIPMAFFALPLAGASGQPAQDAQAPNIFRVEYVLREMENGKVTNTRNFIVTVEGTAPGQRQNRGGFRAGNEVPFYTESQKGNFGTSGKIQYRNVGVDVNCLIDETPGGLTLSTDFNVSSAVSGPSGVAGNPVFRSLNLNDQAAITLGKPILVGSVDDVATDHTYEIRATVTKVR